MNRIAVVPAPGSSLIQLIHHPCKIDILPTASMDDNISAATSLLLQMSYSLENQTPRILSPEPEAPEEVHFLDRDTTTIPFPERTKYIDNSGIPPVELATRMNTDVTCRCAGRFKYSKEHEICLVCQRKEKTRAASANPCLYTTTYNTPRSDNTWWTLSKELLPPSSITSATTRPRLQVELACAQGKELDDSQPWMADHIRADFNTDMMYGRYGMAEATGHSVNQPEFFSREGSEMGMRSETNRYAREDTTGEKQPESSSWASETSDEGLMMRGRSR
ncbi:hypothetical protein BJ878DRAFT_484271 [Calycina marina]|uniref:Uncharacterized protein n=1 Tax=Calycina marina TaxID=1763456 RepID=A0A9P7YUK5_9HELO|nr:hypothetical protein BJ878DRAFT_484271 [Calycina marina]